MTDVNISSGQQNLNQYETKIRPASECNTTASAMCLKYTGHQLPVPYGQLPDYIMSVLGSPEGQRCLQKVSPGASWNPWNDSRVIAWAVNKVMGRDVCITKNATVQEMLFWIMNGGGVSIGGDFLRRELTYGHFVCPVGFVSDQELATIKSAVDIDLSQVSFIRVDDPAGDFNTWYKDRVNGNDILILYADFVKVTWGTAARKLMQFYQRAEWIK